MDQTVGIVNFGVGTYYGEVVNGKAHGYGRITFNDGNVYMVLSRGREHAML